MQQSVFNHFFRQQSQATAALLHVQQSADQPLTLTEDDAAVFHIMPVAGVSLAGWIKIAWAWVSVCAYKFTKLLPVGPGLMFLESIGTWLSSKVDWCPKVKYCPLLLIHGVCCTYAFIFTLNEKFIAINFHTSSSSANMHRHKHSQSMPVFTHRHISNFVYTFHLHIQLCIQIHSTFSIWYLLINTNTYIACMYYTQIYFLFL